MAKQREKSNLENMPIKISEKEHLVLSESIKVLHAVTFTFYTSKAGEVQLIVDPNQEELALYPASLVVIVGQDQMVHGIHRLSWHKSCAMQLQMVAQCVHVAHCRRSKVINLIGQANKCVHLT